MIIAIDGPTASGKGTVAKKIAHHLNLAYLDTGLLYRTVAFSVQDSQNKILDAIEASKNIDLSLLENPQLRLETIGEIASSIAKIPEVRKNLLDFQKNFVQQSFPNKAGYILDGRDIGTVVCPQADHKFFITASLEIRAQRRFQEMQQHNTTTSLEIILEKIKHRDMQDIQRKVAPLKVAPNAHYIDTSHQTIDDVVNWILHKIKKYPLKK